MKVYSTFRIALGLVPHHQMQFSVISKTLMKRSYPSAFVSSQFKCQSSIWPMDRTILGAFTLGQSGPMSDGNEEIPHIPQSFSNTYWSLTIRLFSVVSRTLLEGVLPLSAEVQSAHSIAPADWDVFNKISMKLYKLLLICLMIHNKFFMNCAKCFCTFFLFSLYTVFFFFHHS